MPYTLDPPPMAPAPPGRGTGAWWDSSRTPTPGMMGRGLPPASPTKRPVTTVPVGPLGSASPALAALDAAAPSGSPYYPSDVLDYYSRGEKLPSVPPPPALYGGSTFFDPPGSGPSLASYYEDLAPPADPYAINPVAPDSAYGGPPGLEGLMGLLTGGSAPAGLHGLATPPPVRRPAPGWEPGKTPAMAAYDKRQEEFYSGVPKSLGAGLSKGSTPEMRQSPLLGPVRSTPIPPMLKQRGR